jgi:hypothetical protein
MDMPTFEELRDLARRDPEGFEVLRGKLIDDCIRQSSSRNQRRLLGIQFVIDGRRRVASSPMKALLDIQAMMYESFLSLQQALKVQPCPSESSVPTGARVLPFRRSSTSVD